MTSERNNCGLSSLFPMSCRDRAEAFARSLHSRLSSLGSQDGNDSNDETSWLGISETPVEITQPRHLNRDTEEYLDSGLLESPESPQEEEDHSDLHSFMNKDNLKHSHSKECQCSRFISKRNNASLNGIPRQTLNISHESDNEIYYDTENDLEERSLNNYVNEETSLESSKSETGIYVSSLESTYSTLEEPFQTSSDCTPQPSLVEDETTISEDDVDIAVLEGNAFLGEECGSCNGISNETDYVHHNGVGNFTSQLNVDKDLVVECPSSENKTDQKISQMELQVNNDEDEDEDNDDIPRVRRCSSLRTGKTPPNTPGRKKIVRFADALGLDLADVRTFLDEIPKVPNSAYEDLKDVDLDETSSEFTYHPTTMGHKFHGMQPDKLLVPLFQQPGGMPNFLDLVREHKVCLENALVDDPALLSITGTVRVRNLDFHKSVHIRYSLDAWKTFADVKAVYVENSCDGFSDKFSFIIYANTLTVGQRLEFACRFSCKGIQYWDNNNGVNYCFQCMPSVNPAQTYSPVAPTIDHWGASFY